MVATAVPISWLAVESTLAWPELWVAASTDSFRMSRFGHHVISGSPQSIIRIFSELETLTPDGIMIKRPTKEPS